MRRLCRMLVMGVYYNGGLPILKTETEVIG
jgi:hypothetical protein